MFFWVPKKLFEKETAGLLGRVFKHLEMDQTCVNAMKPICTIVILCIFYLINQYIPNKSENATLQ